MKLNVRQVYHYSTNHNAFYRSKYTGILADSDIDNIHTAYGVKKNTTIVTTTATTTTTTSTATTTFSDQSLDDIDDVSNPDLCQIKPTKFLITSIQRMYIFHNKWVSTLKIGDEKYRDPQKNRKLFPI